MLRISTSLSRIRRIVKHFFILSYLMLISFFVYTVSSYSNPSSIPERIENETQIFLREHENELKKLSVSSLQFVLKYEKLSSFLQDIIPDEKHENLILSLILNYISINRDIRSKNHVDASEIEQILISLFGLKKSKQDGEYYFSI